MSASTGDVIVYHWCQSGGGAVVWTPDFLNASPTWSRVANIPAGTITGCDVPHKLQSTMWICGAMGVYRSDNWQDASPTWTQKLTMAAMNAAVGFNSDWNGENAVADMVCSPVNSDTVYVVAQTGAGPVKAYVGKTTDGGTSWSWIFIDNQWFGESGGTSTYANYGGHQGCIMASVNDKDVFSLGLGGEKLFLNTTKVYDGGQFWTARGGIFQKTGSYDTYTIEGLDGSYAKYGVGLGFVGSTPNLVLQANRPFAQNWADGKIYIINTPGGGNWQGNGEVYSSVDDGHTYTLTSATVWGRLGRIAVFQNDSAKVAIACTKVGVNWNGVIYYSSNGGSSWSDKIGNMASVLSASQSWGMGYGRVVWLDGYVTPDFSIDVTPSSVTIHQGDIVDFTVTVNSIGFFVDPVTLTLSGTPPATTQGWTVNPVVPGNDTILTLGTTLSTTPGTYVVTIHGVSGVLAHDANTTITIIVDLAPVPDPATCYPIVLPDIESIAPAYYILLRDQSGKQVALFDDWITLNYTEEVNNTWSYVLEINGLDARQDLFQLDCQLEVWRAVLGAGVKWYRDFEGLHRKSELNVDSDGRYVFISSGVGYNELLARSVIAYKAGTIRADKDCAAETAMKEYVEENCGPTADDTVVGRLYQGGLPNFYTEPDTGRGPIWVGSRAYENLLDVVREIAIVSKIDFQVISAGEAAFMFVVLPNQFGVNRTVTALIDPNGLNSYGYPPVVFSVPMGTVQEMNYALDRLSEANVVIVLGDGEVSLRDTLTVYRPDAIDDSPWNRREVSRPASLGDVYDVTNQMTILGEQTLEEMSLKEIFSFQPLQQPAMLYGRDYFLGDRITLQHGSIQRDKRIISITVNVADNKEEITLGFEEAI